MKPPSGRAVYIFHRTTPQSCMSGVCELDACERAHEAQQQVGLLARLHDAQAQGSVSNVS